MPDVMPEMAMGMIMPRCSPGFFPGMKVFMNAGAPANGQPICDWGRYTMATDELKRQMVLLPTDYLQGANGTDWKPPLYLSVQVVKDLEDRPDLCVDLQKRDGY